ncbi:MAG: alpha-E domain-containing protein [Fimbriimonadaceae bacterium]|nr:alpha-E domain-containing protein [Fimbriimonadaceae bacterium]
MRLASALYFGGTHIGLLGDPQLPADLVGVLGAAPDQPPFASLGEAVEWCVCDPANPSSAASYLQAARENTRRAREVLSLELWEIISEATMRLLEFRTRQAAVEEDLLAVPWWTRAYYGVVESALPRDEARAVLRLGVDTSALT